MAPLILATPALIFARSCVRAAYPPLGLSATPPMIEINPGIDPIVWQSHLRAKATARIASELRGINHDMCTLPWSQRFLNDRPALWWLAVPTVWMPGDMAPHAIDELQRIYRRQFEFLWRWRRADGESVLLVSCHVLPQ